MRGYSSVRGVPMCPPLSKANPSGQTFTRLRLHGGSCSLPPYVFILNFNLTSENGYKDTEGRMDMQRSDSGVLLRLAFRLSCL